MMMIYKNDDDVKALVTAFEQRALSKEDWTHAAHLTVALYYCRHHTFGAARNLMRDGIYWLNDRHGTPNTDSSGYHETLTCFWMATVREFLKRRDAGTGLAELANELIASCHDSGLPLRFYSRELLFSTNARLNYVEPDLAADLNFGNLFYNKPSPEVFA